MIGRYAVVAGRIRHDLDELYRVVARGERAVQAGRRHAADQDLLLDAAALNLHDFYTGLERVFRNIASGVDRSTPFGSDWHRELPRQMTIDLPGIRPVVLSIATAEAVDEYLRFRHVIRHIYAFHLDPGRVEHLAGRLRPTFREVARELTAFAALLDGMAREE